MSAQGTPSRSSAHVIDTAAMRKVAEALPAEWVERELTRRDYGLDLLVELFSDQRSADSVLLLQVKGKDVVWVGDEPIDCQFPVATLLYAELFVAPVLAVLCPIREPQPTHAYLWLQEYIEVVLDRTHPTWRTQKTVRITFPPENRMPGRKDHLTWIAGHPARLKALGQITRLLHEMRDAASSLDVVGLDTAVAQADLARVQSLLEEARSHAMVVVGGEESSGVIETIDHGVAAVTLLQSGSPFESGDLEALGSTLTADGKRLDSETIRWVVQGHLASTANQLEALVAIWHDAGIRATLVAFDGTHRF